MNTLPTLFYRLCLLASALLASLIPATAQNRVCIAPDNGAGTIDFPAQCPYGNARSPIELLTSNGELVTLEIDIPPMLMTCRPGTNPPKYDSGINSPQAIAIPAFIKYVKQSKTAEVGVNLVLSVRNTPRSPAGADVQIFDTEILQMRLDLPGIGNADWDILSCVAQEGGTGQTTITRLPSGDFTVDSFFDIAYQIQIEGAAGGEFEGDVVNTTASARLSQTNSTFQGVSYTPLDGAKTRVTDAGLIIDNLGSSGCDGVGISLGGGDTGGLDNDCDAIALDLESCSPTGSFLADGETMSMFPFPPPPLDLPDLPALPSSMVLTNSGGVVSGVCTSNGLGATSWSVEVWNNDVLVASTTAADGAVCYSVPSSLFNPKSVRVGAFRGHGGNKKDKGRRAPSTTVVLTGAVEVTVAGAPAPVVGNRVVCSPRDPQILPGLVSSLEVRSSSSAGICITGVAITKYGIGHSGLDEAVLSSTASGGLLADNLGSSGCDGVSISLGGGGDDCDDSCLPLEVELSPLDVQGSGGSLFSSAHDGAGVSLIEAEYRSGGASTTGSVHVTAPAAMTTCRVTVQNDGVFVGEFDVPLTAGVSTQVCSVGVGADGPPLLTGCGKRALGWPWELSCLVEEYDRPIPITPVGVTALVGDEVQFLLPDAGPASVAGLREFQVRASGIPEFEICGESKGSRPPHPVLTAEDHASFDYPGTGSRMSDSVPKYITSDNSKTICIFSSLKDIVKVAEQGNRKTYTATLQLDIEGVDGLSFSRSVELPGNFVIQHGPNAFSGQDVQQFGTQVRSCVFTLPAGDPDFSLLRVSGGSDSGFDSPGDIIISKIPECVFIYEEIQKILAELDITGTPGGGLTGGRVFGAAFEQNLHIDKPSVIFGGLANASTGAANVQIDAGGRLQLDNLGSSGCDGVSISVGGGQAFGVSFDPLSPPQFLDGGTLTFEEFGDVRGQSVGGSLGTCVCTTVYGGGNPLIYNVSVDFSSVAPSSITLQALDGGVVVGEFPVAATSASYEFRAGAAGLPPIKGVGKLPALSATPCKVIRWCGSGTFQLQGQAPVTCDEVRMLAHGVPFETISSFELRASDEIDHCIVIEEELSTFFGRPMRGVDGGSISARAARAGSRALLVDNLGSSGCDGVSISPPPDGSGSGEAPPMVIDVAGVDLGGLGSSLVCDPRGTVAGNAGTSLGSVTLLNTETGDVSLGWDFSAVGATQARVKLYTNDGRASENPLYCGREVYNNVLAGTNPGGSSDFRLNKLRAVAVSASGDADDRPTGVGAFYNKIVVTLAEPTEITVPGGPPIEVTRIEVSVVDPTSTASSLEACELRGTNMKAFVIEGVSSGPIFPHGLPTQSVGSGRTVRGGIAGSARTAEVSNLGSSGLDGVAIDLGEAEGVSQKWLPIDLAPTGGTMRVMKTRRTGAESMERNDKGRIRPRAALVADHEPFVFYDIILMVDPGIGGGTGSGLALGTEVLCLDDNGNVTGRYPISAVAGIEQSVGALEPVDAAGLGRIISTCLLPPTVIEGEGYIGERLCLEFEEQMTFTPGGGGAACVCTRLMMDTCHDNDCDDDGVCGASSVVCTTFSGLSSATCVGTLLHALDGGVYASIGDARLDACRASSVLGVSNLGSSGLDGVSLVGPPDGFETEIVSMSLLDAGIVTGFLAGDPDRPIVVGGAGTVDGSPSPLGSVILHLDNTDQFVPISYDFISLFGGGVGDLKVIVKGKKGPAPGGGSFVGTGVQGTACYCFPGGASVVAVCRLDERDSPSGSLGPGYCIDFDIDVEITAPGGAPGSGFVGDRVEIRAQKASGSWDTEMLSMDLRGTRSAGHPYMKLGDIKGEALAPTDFGDWIIGHFTPAQIDQLDQDGYCTDLDGDGYCEVEEFIFGLDPNAHDSPSTKPDLSSSVRPGPVGEDEEFLRFTYEYDPRLQGTTRELGVSTDLVVFDFSPALWRLVAEEGLPTGKRRATYELNEPVGAAARKVVKFKAGADLSKKVN